MAAPIKKPLKIIDSEEVHLRNNEESAWFTVKNKDKNRTEVFDVTRFLNLHPGGKAILLKYAGKDVTEEFFTPVYHAHSEKAQRMLQNYLHGIVADEKNDMHSQVEGIEMSPLQNLIDWKLPLLAQVMALKDPKVYQTWLHSVHNPYKRIKIFTTQVLEDYFTHYPWWYVFAWIPVSLYCVSQSLKYNQMNFLLSAILFCFGAFSWTFCEYLIHRFLFHVHTESQAGNFYHFFAHGIHHLTPLDEERLTFPPVFSCVLGVGLLFLFEFVMTPIFSSSFAWIGGLSFGFMLYDIFHYLFHHGPEWVQALPYVRTMKTRHMMHHYSNPNLNFGVTSPLFDIIFGTNDTAKL